MSRLTKFLLIVPMMTLCLLWTMRASAYDNQTTHPALTDQIVDFYNLSFPNNSITTEEKEWLVQGSIDEDVVPRMMNHFYDPTTGQGWTGEGAGNIHADALLRLSEIGSGFTSLPATRWSTDYLVQQAYLLYGGNHSWKQGLDEYAEDKKKEAFITLGHILHLIEDMSVPDHTRNDTHMDAAEGVTGDKGSPYEQYASRWNRVTIEILDLPAKIAQENNAIPNKPIIEDYLASLAQYSNKYFFSKDTVESSKYGSPKIIKKDSNYGYGLDENGAPFKLVVVDTSLQNGEKEYIYSLKSKVEYDPVFDAYFARLSRQILLHGAGIINLFLRQAEDAKFNLGFQKPANAFYFSILKPTGDVATAAKFSPAGFFANIYSAFSSILDSVKGAASRSMGLVAGLIGANNPSPLKESSVLAQADTDNEFVLGSADRISQNITPTADISSESTPNKDNVSPQHQTAPSAITENKSPPPSSSENQSESENIENHGSETHKIPTPIFPGSGGGGAGPIGGVTATFPVVDNLPPEAISDLVASGIASSSLVLRWTVPSDTGGSIASYTIAYSTTTITEANWSSHKTLALPYPFAAGEKHELSVSALSPSTVYYFAIRSVDSSGNESATSNLVSATTLSASAVSNVDHVLISELQIAGADAGDEFIELYNPTNEEVDISGWSIQYLSGGATSTLFVQKKNLEGGSSILPLGYFLIARAIDASGGDGYVGSTVPDITHRSFSLSEIASGATVFLVSSQNEVGSGDDLAIVDKVAYGSGSGLSPESFAAGDPVAGQSLERLAWRDGACLTSSGANEFWGNGCDNQNNSTDFEQRSTPNPQNSSSLPETRSAPTINGFAAEYSLSTMSVDFSWLPSEDGAGATSTNVYAISIINATSSPSVLWNGTSTTFSTGVFEETSYLFEVKDRDNLSAEASTTVTAPFFSYKGTVFEQTATSTAYEIGGQSSSHYWAQSFKPQRTGRVNAVTIHLVGSGGRLDGIADCSLKIYKTDSPHATSSANLVGSAYETSQGETMHGGPCVNGNSLGIGQFNFATSTLDAGETYILVYSYRDATHYPQLLGSNDEINGEYWVDGIAHPQKDAALTLGGIIMSAPMNPEAPSQPANLQTSFDPAKLLLNISWDISVDVDSPPDEIIYQVNVTTSTEFPVGNWASIGPSTLATTTVAFPDSYLIGVRAGDEFRDLSSIATSSWSFPTGFSMSNTIAEQLDTNGGDLGGNGQDGGKTNQYGQTFTVGSSSVPYSIVLNTAGTQSGYCGVKVYSAGSIDNASSGNLVAQSEEIFGSGCNAADGKTFNFTSTGELVPGTTYIWIYSAWNGAGMADGIVGGYNADGYPGRFFKKRNDEATGTTGALPATNAAYFRLLGNVE